MSAAMFGETRGWFGDEDFPEYEPGTNEEIVVERMTVYGKTLPELFVSIQECVEIYQEYDGLDTVQLGISWVRPGDFEDWSPHRIEDPPGPVFGKINLPEREISTWYHTIYLHWDAKYFQWPED